MGTGTTRLSLLPQQMVSDSVKKTDKWKKQNIDAFENLVLFDNRQLRASYANKVTNYNLAKGILDMNDVKHVYDPRGMGSNTFPARMQHIGIGNNKINVLLGEYISRKFDARVIVSNMDGVSRKEEEKIKKHREFFIEQLKQESIDENDFKQKLNKHKDYLDYEWQDIAELGANKILKYSIRSLEINEKMWRSFEDALRVGEQIMVIDDLSNELVVRKGDPLKWFTLMNSDAIDERGLEAAIEVNYYTVSTVLDMFYDKLETEDVEKLKVMTQWGVGKGTARYSDNAYAPYGQLGELNPYNALYNISDLEKSYFASAFDANHNIRVLTCYWKSKRKIKKIKVINEYGIEECQYKHEKYKVSADRGEVFEKDLWVNEWWRGYKVGTDIYVSVEPIPFLSTSIENICNQSPPIIIQLHNTNSNRAQSLMDIIKPLDYLYDIFSYKREMLVNKMRGDLFAFPTSMIPDNMTIEEFMNYVESTGDVPLDPTAEIISGPQAGRAAGTYNTIRAEMIGGGQGGPINILNNILADVINTMDMVSGITKQREGSISTSELVGNVQRSVQQSSYGTEKWFATADNFRRRVYRQILDRQINLLRKNPKKLAYIMDDFTAGVITDEELESVFLSEFDVHVSNSSEDALLQQKIEKLFEMAMQAGTATISDMIDVYKNDSISTAARKLKVREQERMEQQQLMEQKNQEIQQAIAQQEAEQVALDNEIRLAELEKDYYEIDENNRVKIEIAVINSFKTISETPTDSDMDGIPDPVELGKLALEQQKVGIESLHKNQDRLHQLQIEDKKKEQIEIQNKNQEKLKLMDMKQKEKELKMKEKIERLKIRNKPKPKSK
jgi:hypothetical protein